MLTNAAPFCIYVNMSIAADIRVALTAHIAGRMDAQLPRHADYLVQQRLHDLHDGFSDYMGFIAAAARIVHRCATVDNIYVPPALPCGESLWREIDGTVLFRVPRYVPDVDAAMEPNVVTHMLETGLGEFVQGRLDKEQEGRDEGKDVSQPFKMPCLDTIVVLLRDVALAWRQQLASVRAEKPPKRSDVLEEHAMPRSSK